MNKVLNYFLLVCALVFGSCSHVQEPELGNSAIVFLGDQSKTDVFDVLSTEDGGVLLVSHTRQNKHKDIKLVKLNELLVVEWERTIGGAYDDEVQHVFIDKVQNILISGFARGFNNPSTDLSNQLYWNAYHHLLDADGNTIWEEIHERYPTSEQDQLVTDVMQDSDGNYLITGNYETIPIDPDGQVYFPADLPVVRKIDPQGVLLSEFVVLQYRAKGRIQALFETGETYIAFSHNLFNSSDEYNGEAFRLEKDRMEGVEEFIKLDSITSSQMAGELEPYIGKSKVIEADNSLSLYYFYADNAYKFTLSNSDQKLRVEMPNLGVQDIKLVKKIGLSSYLFINQNNEVVETDLAFNEVKRFASNYNLERVCKLADKSYVGAFAYRNSLYLAHFNSSGVLLDHE